MLVLLRNRATGLYYSGLGNWTHDPSIACDFRQIDLATNFAIDHQLDDAYVILDYFSPQCQLTLPVRRDWIPESLRLIAP
jgi:hypothetical protein